MPHLVLTGDLIDSQSHTPDSVDRAMTVLRDIAGHFAHDLDPALHFTRFRGDGWQVFVKDASRALTATLALHAALRAAGPGIDTRIAIGIGSLTRAGARNLSDASGTAFVASGAALEVMSPKRRLAIAGQGIGPWQRAVIALAERVSDGWTPQQAEAALIWLTQPDLTQGQIAKQLGITRQAVQSRLAGVGINHLSPAIDAFQHLFDDSHPDGTDD